MRTREVAVIDGMPQADAVARLEQALARVEAAAQRLQRQRSRAQARYDLLDRAGSDALAAIDALITAPDDDAGTQNSGLSHDPGSTRSSLVATAAAA